MGEEVMAVMVLGEGWLSLAVCLAVRFLVFLTSLGGYCRL